VSFLFSQQTLRKYRQKDLFRYSRKVECLQRWFPRRSRRNVPRRASTKNRPTLLFLPLFTDIHPGAHSALTSIRKVITISNPSGSATSHVVVRCTLADIAHSMNLRVKGACGCWT
ncbi:hypothetical protein EDC04DRAFT_2624366, partial [Pisolithus marmoratus]